MTDLATTTSAPLATPDGILTSLVAAWLLAQRSEHTRRAYRRDLEQWTRWCHEHDLAPLAVRRAHIDAYSEQLARGGQKPATISRKVSTISSWYGYLEAEEVIARNPAKRARRPRINPDHTDTEGLDLDEARRVIEAAEADGPRSAVIVRLMLEVGLRSAEVASAVIEGLGHERGHHTLTVTRKNGDRQRMALPAAVQDAIARTVGARTSGPIVATSTGRAMAASEIFRTVQRLARAAGVSRRITPHGLRHTCATLALDAGAPLRDVQDLMGHNDPRTTRRYDRARNNLDRSAAYRVAGLLGL